MKQADQVTKNPSRSIRFPNNSRNDGKKLKQSLVEIKKRVGLSHLNVWLSKYESCKPVIPEAPPIRETIHSDLDIPSWILTELESGIFYERNNTWFRLSAALAKKGFGELDIVSILEPYYVEQPDFKRKEWVTSIRHGIKVASQR